MSASATSAIFLIHPPTPSRCRPSSQDRVDGVGERGELALPPPRSALRRATGRRGGRSLAPARAPLSGRVRGAARRWARRVDGRGARFQRTHSATEAHASTGGRLASRSPPVAGRVPRACNGGVPRDVAATSAVTPSREAKSGALKPPVLLRSRPGCTVRRVEGPALDGRSLRRNASRVGDGAPLGRVGAALHLYRSPTNRWGEPARWGKPETQLHERGDRGLTGLSAPFADSVDGRSANELYRLGTSASVGRRSGLELV